MQSHLKIVYCSVNKKEIKNVMINCVVPDGDGENNYNIVYLLPRLAIKHCVKTVTALFRSNVLKIPYVFSE